MLVADPVAHGFRQVRGERLVIVVFERVEPPERPQHDVVDDVGSVGNRSDPAREAAVGEAMEAGQRANEQGFQRAGVTRRAGVERQRVAAGRRRWRRHERPLT